MMSLILSHPRVQPGDNVRSSNSLSNSVHFQGVSDLAAPLPSKQEWEWGRLCSRDHHPPFVRCFEILTNIFIVARLSFAGWCTIHVSLERNLTFCNFPSQLCWTCSRARGWPAMAEQEQQAGRGQPQGARETPQAPFLGAGNHLSSYSNSNPCFFCNLCFVLTNIVPARGMNLLHPPHECQALLRSPKLASPLPFPEV